jgi:hypothetical protein
MFDVYVIPKESLLVARPKGVLDAEDARRILDFIELKEIEVETGFNRFCDLTSLLGIHLLVTDFLGLLERRQTFNPNDIRVKSAFYATNGLAFGVACMYEQLLNSPRIEVRVTSSMQSAADWLGVSLDRLKL